MFACENNAADSARLLLGLEKHIFLFDGRTALHIACESNSNACVELLARELGSVRDKHGRSSLFSAAEGNTTAISILLLVASFSKKEIQQAKSTLKSLGIPSDELLLMSMQLWTPTGAQMFQVLTSANASNCSLLRTRMTALYLMADQP